MYQHQQQLKNFTHFTIKHKLTLLVSCSFFLFACGSPPAPTDDEMRESLISFFQEYDDIAYKEQQQMEGYDVTPERTKVFSAKNNKCDELKNSVYLCDVTYEAKQAYGKMEKDTEKFIISKVGSKWLIDGERTFQYQETGQLPANLDID